MLCSINWVIFCKRKKKQHRFPFLFLCIVKRDNSYRVCVCFLMMTYNACFLKKRSCLCLIFFYNYGTCIWWVNHVKSIGGNSWAQILIYSKITTSSITTNARLQQETFTCLLKNLKMLSGYQPIFSLVSQSNKRLRIILFPWIFIINREKCGIPLLEFIYFIIISACPMSTGGTLVFTIASLLTDWNSKTCDV